MGRGGVSRGRAGVKVLEDGEMWQGGRVRGRTSRRAYS
jgi:hypothetical protein